MTKSVLSALASVCFDGNFKYFCMEDCIRSNVCSAYPTVSLFKRNSTLFESGGTIQLVSLNSGQVLQDYRGSHKHESFKLESCISSDDNHIITCSEDGYIVDYDLVSGKVHSRTSTVSEHPQNFSNHLSNSLSSLSYHPKLPLLLTASYNGCVRIWDCSCATDVQ